MASPANWRSGHSRRAQYTTFLSYAAGVLGVVLGLALLAISFVNPALFTGIRGAAADFAEPIGSASAQGREGGRKVFNTLAGYLKAGSEHARLKRELAEAKVRLVEAQATQVENRRLKALLGLSSAESQPVAAARLTSSTATSSRRLATLSIGSNKGVQTGMPVRSEMGLVGRVLEVNDTSARVLLVTDSESLVPVRRAKDGLPAFAQGVGDGTIRIRLINLGINPLRLGDVFVTSGSGGLYRPGTPLAITVKLNPDGAIARVLGNPSDTDYVVIDPIWTPETRPRALPAAAAPPADGGR